MSTAPERACEADNLPGNATLSPPESVEPDPLTHFLQLMWAKEYDLALTLANRFCEMTGPDIPDEAVTLSRTLRGTCLRQVGRISEAIKDLLEAEARAASRQDPAELMGILWELAVTYLCAGQTPSAVDILRRIESDVLAHFPAELVGDRMSPDQVVQFRGGVELQLAMEHLWKDELNAAEPLLTSAVAALQRGPVTEELGVCHHHRGNLFRRSGRQDDALTEYSSAIEILKAFPPGTALGLAHYYRATVSVLRNIPEAITDLTAAIDIFTACNGPSKTIGQAYGLRAVLRHWYGTLDLGGSDFVLAAQHLRTCRKTRIAIRFEVEWARFLGSIGDTTQAISKVDSAIAAALHLQEMDLALEGRCCRCMILYESGNYCEAHRQSTELLKDLPADVASEILVKCCIAAASSQYQVGQRSTAVGTAERGVRAVDPQDWLMTSSMLSTYAMVLNGVGRSEEAAVACERAEHLLGENGFPQLRGNILLHKAASTRIADEGFGPLANQALKCSRLNDHCNRHIAESNHALHMLGFDSSAADELLSSITSDLVLAGRSLVSFQVRIQWAAHYCEDHPVRALEILETVDVGSLPSLVSVDYYSVLVTARAQSESPLTTMDSVESLIDAIRHSATTIEAADVSTGTYIERQATLATAVFALAKRNRLGECLALMQEAKGVFSRDVAVPLSGERVARHPAVVNARKKFVDACMAGHRDDVSSTRPFDDLVTEYAQEWLIAQADIGLKAGGGLNSLGKTRCSVQSIVAPIQRSLPEKWVLLDFWQIDECRTFIIVVKSDSLAMVQLPTAIPTKQLVERVKATRLSGRTNDAMSSMADRYVWDDLYDHVFVPLREHLQSCEGLYLVPHGDWHNVPLHVARSFDTGLSRRQILCETFSVAYLPSAAMLPQLPEPVAPHSCVAFINPDRGTDKTLPFTEWEVACFKEMLGERRLEVHQGTGATSQAAAEWSRYDLLTFGCHGAAEHRLPGLSRLYLADDCILSHDILFRYRRLKQGAMVILNGCQTGGKFQRAVNESLGLMTAFLSRGASVVLANPWAIEDASAARISTEFVRELSGGEKAGDAFRMAMVTIANLEVNEVKKQFNDLRHLLSERDNPAEWRKLDSYFRSAQTLLMTASSTPGRPKAVRQRLADDPSIWAGYQLWGRIA